MVRTVGQGEDEFLLAVSSNHVYLQRFSRNYVCNVAAYNHHLRVPNYLIPSKALIAEFDIAASP